MKFIINWTKSSKGNSFVEGDVLKIHAAGASHISGAIYRNGSPVLAIFGMGENAKIMVKRKGMNLKGMAVLKLRAFDSKHRGFGIDDAFSII